jgi:hypothetical protein
MTNFVFANNVNTTLAGAVSSGATNITLSSTQNLPSSIPAGQVLVITLNDAATRNNYEIVYATAITGATLTVVRGQEGTSALAWLTGDFAFSPPTAGQMGNMGQLGGNNTWSGNNSFSNPIAVGNATASGQALTKGQAELEFALLAGSSSQTFNVANASSSVQAMPLGQLPSQFPSVLSANGYKKYPDSNSPTGYFIEQWGTGTFPTQLTTTANFPIAFPNTSLNFVCGLGSAINLTTFTSCGGQAISNSQFQISVGAPTGGADAVWWTAKGY